MINDYNWIGQDTQKAISWIAVGFLALGIAGKTFNHYRAKHLENLDKIKEEYVKTTSDFNSLNDMIDSFVEPEYRLNAGDKK